MTPDILRAVIALLFVLGLLWLMGLAIRKYGWKLGLPAPMTPGRTRRLRMLEVLPVDTRHKLILIRHDNVEHLLLVGGQESVIIEKNMPASESEKTS